MTASRRVLTVFGTRPEAIKLFPLVHALAGDPRFVSRVCVSGQHCGMLDQVLAISGITPAYLRGAGRARRPRPVQLGAAGRARRQGVYDSRGIWPDQPGADAEPEELRKAG